MTDTHARTHAGFGTRFHYMASRKRHILLTRLALPVAAVAAADVLTRVLWPIMEGNLSLMFITAVMISALYGGAVGGAVASILAAAASAFFHLPPARSFDLNLDEFLRLAVFLAAAILVSWLNGARRRWEEALRDANDLLEARVAARTADLAAANAELHNEIAERVRAQEQTLAYQARLQSLASETSKLEERQRREIAAGLHDAVGHRLAVAVLKLRTHLQGPQEPAAASALARAAQLVEEAIDHTRSLTLQLSPPVLYELGLEPAVEWLGEQVEREHGLAVTTHDDGAEKPLDNETRSLLFAAVRELLVNVVKHARAANVQVALARVPGGVSVTVEDDGAGFDPPARPAGNPTGFGLFHLRERIAHLGGQFHVQSAAGRGCRVTIVAPLPPSLVATGPAAAADAAAPAAPAAPAAAPAGEMVPP